MNESKRSSDVSSTSDPTTTIDELKYTRYLSTYLDMLNVLKNKYLVILCLKNTSGQNIIEAAVEKIHSIGFSGFTAEPDMKYVGVMNSGSIVSDISSTADEQPLSFELSVSKTKVFISFEEKEAEIKIGGKDHALNDKGINIVVYDLNTSEVVDVSCYNAAEKNPTFHHRNFYYDEQYTDSHIYMPESYRDSITLPIRKSYFSNRRLNVREVERGIFLTTRYVYELDKEKDGYDQKIEELKSYGGVCDENINLIAGHQLFYPRGIDLDSRHIYGSYDVSPEDITYIDETVLYGGSLIEHPGHLIMECFADRLWWIAENADSDIKIAIEIIWENSPLGKKYNSFVMEFLDAFGISEDRLIIIKKPTQFKKIIIPDQSAIPFNYCFPYDFTSEYIKVFQHITKRLTPGKHKKIYLTKSKNHNKTLIGEEYFIDFFEKKGFTVIHPEDYTIKEKAELMYGAEEVVTVDGTSSLFTVFCKPTVKLTILTRRLDFWDTPQQLINEAVGIKEFFLVNISGSFLENFSDKTFLNFSRGLVLAYATKEFAKYVKYVYDEDLDITPDESLKKHFYDYLTYFSEYYTQPSPFFAVSNIKMTDILRSMSEVFLGKELDTSGLDFTTDNERTIKKLKAQLREEKETSAVKIRNLSEKTKEYTEENERLKQYLTQLESENRQLRETNSELSSYMAEISSLLDALEAGNDQ